MNLALRLRRDKPSLKDLFQSSWVVSLWDVLKFCADDFISLSWTLGELHGVVHTLASHEPNRTTVPRFPMITKKCMKVLDVLLSMELQIAAHLTETLIEEMGKENEIEMSRFVEMIIGVESRIETDLQRELLARIEPKRTIFYKDEKAFLGEDIISQLSKITTEAKEAGKCFAFERYTACAFHLMRIMEYVVQEFAKKVRIDFDPDEDSWGPILDRIWKQKIEGWPKSPTKKKYSACYKLMDGIREWRNNIMHQGEWYTEERVEELRGTVKSCVRDFLKLPDPIQSR